MTNDLPALSVGQMIFEDVYTLNGNELTLTGDVWMLHGTFNAPLKVGGTIHLGGTDGQNSYGAIDVNGQTVTIFSSNSTVGSLSGSGTVIVHGNGFVITGDSSFSGTINPCFSARGSMPSANVTLSNVPSQGSLSGTGSVGVVTMDGPELTLLSPGAHSPGKFVETSPGVLHTKSLSLSGSSSYLAELAPRAMSDSVQVTGTVTLNAQLLITTDGVPSVGQSFVIIDNDGTDPVSGTFTGRPERSKFTLLGRDMRISYQGGDGNDVVLSVLADTTAVLTQNASITGLGEAWTLTSTVSSASGVPSGSVSFSADGVPLGTAAVVNGVATLTIFPATPGPRNVIATFLGTGIFADSISGSITHSVGKAQTEIDARARTAFVGDSPIVSVVVDVVPSSSIVPTGSVTLSEGAVVLGAQSLAGGKANVSLGPLAIGDHTLTVRYSGDAGFEPSSTTIIQTVVAPAISIHGVHVIEGNQGITAVSLVASLSAPVSQAVRVSFTTVAGSATEGEDYERAGGVIDFAPGELTHAIEIHVIGDSFPETDETFSVVLSDPVNATIDTPSAVIVIANDDQVPPRHRPSRH